MRYTIFVKYILNNEFFFNRMQLILILYEKYDEEMIKTAEN